MVLQWQRRNGSSPTKENRVHPTKISTKTEKDGFMHTVFEIRTKKKPVTEFYRVCCACVLFSLGKSMQRMNSRVPFRSQNIFFLRTSEGFPLVSALEFRYCGEILLVDQKQTFDQRTSCITRHDDLPTRSHGAFHCPAPFLRDCKSRGRRRHS